MSRKEPAVTPLFKTRLCNFYFLGKCKLGRRCTFAHGEGELRVSPDFEKTSVCPTFLARGQCTNPRCRYAHNAEELRSNAEFLKTKMCGFHVSGGNCMLGEACRFAHSEEELREAEEVQKRQVTAQDACVCGVALMPQENFCRNCGVPRSQFPPRPQKAPTCLCGSTFQAEENFCRNCGLPRPQPPRNSRAAMRRAFQAPRKSSRDVRQVAFQAPFQPPFQPPTPPAATAQQSAPTSETEESIAADATMRPSPAAQQTMQATTATVAASPGIQPCTPAAAVAQPAPTSSGMNTASARDAQPAPTAPGNQASAAEASTTQRPFVPMGRQASAPVGAAQPPATAPVLLAATSANMQPVPLVPGMQVIQQAVAAAHFHSPAPGMLGVVAVPLPPGTFMQVPAPATADAQPVPAVPSMHAHTVATAGAAQLSPAVPVAQAVVQPFSDNCTPAAAAVAEDGQAESSVHVDCSACSACAACTAETAGAKTSTGAEGASQENAAQTTQGPAEDVAMQSEEAGVKIAAGSAKEQAPDVTLPSQPIQGAVEVAPQLPQHIELVLQARLMRYLALHPRPRISLEAAALIIEAATPIVGGDSAGATAADANDSVGAAAADGGDAAGPCSADAVGAAGFEVFESESSAGGADSVRGGIPFRVKVSTRPPPLLQRPRWVDYEMSPREKKSPRAPLPSPGTDVDWPSADEVRVLVDPVDQGLDLPELEESRPNLKVVSASAQAADADGQSVRLRSAANTRLVVQLDDIDSSEQLAHVRGALKFVSERVAHIRKSREAPKLDSEQIEHLEKSCGASSSGTEHCTRTAEPCGAAHAERQGGEKIPRREAAVSPEADAKWQQNVAQAQKSAAAAFEEATGESQSAQGRSSCCFCDGHAAQRSCCRWCVGPDTKVFVRNTFLNVDELDEDGVAIDNRKGSMRRSRSWSKETW